MLMGADAPGEFIRMAENMAATMLGKPEGSYEILRVHIDTQQPNAAPIEVLIAPHGSATGRDHELLAAEQQMLALLQREDIHMLNISAIDQARETIDFVANEVPAYGLKTFWVYPLGIKEEASTAAISTLSGEQLSIENEWYRVEASEEDGTLTITDKKTGAVFTGLNRFVDSGDIGDLYNYCPPAQDVLVSQPLEPPKIELVSTGPVRAVLRVIGRWLLPCAISADRTERSSRTAACQIVSDISLTPGVRRVDIHTSIDNRVKDHRLRVVFPVPYRVEHVAAEGTFEVRTRPVAAERPENVADWSEEPINTFPQKRFVDISNGTTGLGVLNRGLPEYEILQDGPGLAPGHMAVALTLLRCVEWLSRATLLEVEPSEIVVSAIKRSNTGKGLIVRLYNPFSHAVEASMRPGVDLARAFVANLQEEEQEQLFWSGDEGEPVHVGLRSGEIKTILFQ